MIISTPNPLPSRDEYFRELLKPPRIAWPTVTLFGLSLTIIVFSTYFTVTDRLPLWLGALLNGFAMYNLFSVAHDAAHRALSSNRFINETFGRLAVMMFMPMAPFEAVRWIHMQHHRFTNGESDPDRHVHHAKWWQLPLMWPNVDLFYIAYFIRYGGDQLKKNIKPLMIYTIVFVVLVSVAISNGYGWDVLFLWFIASRFGLFLIDCVFVYLPHYPGHISAEDDVYKASTIRRGGEWFLTPLMVSQNYHLIHHLYPTLPFYRYQKVWHLKYDELVSKNPAVQTTFGLQPVNIKNQEPLL
jgi:fatty acid desaturase